jgi:DNA polymerase III subunit epsilon
VLHWLKPTSPLLKVNRKYFNGFDRKQSLKEYSFVVFDTELTGLGSRRGEIISIGAVKIENLQINLGQTFSTFVKPLRMQHTTATLIHKITPEQLKNAPDVEEVLPEFLEFLGNSLLVGHCIDIDMRFLDKICRRLYGGTLANPTIDTMLLARGYQGKLSGWYHDHGSINKGYNLRTISQQFQLPVFEEHNALGDALQTAYLFLYLVKKFRSGGLETLLDLYQAGKAGKWAGEA